MSKTNNWLTASINPPPMDKPLIARSKDIWGLGPRYEILEFDSKIMCPDSVIGAFQNYSLIEWKFIEDKDAKEFNCE